ncbi:MAG: S1 RNA-binding domain-containing protein [Desulfovibrionaceae bacterium]|nr:S1 RNA-binding domain-containing protein [Desulfovibrionaceae bacterium]
MNEEQQMVQDDQEDFAALFEQQEIGARKQLQPGQKVSGTVIDISGDNVFVDIGIKVDGIMDRKDILNAEGQEEVKKGDTVEAWVVRVTPQEVHISRSMGGSGLAALEDACASAIPVDGTVTGTCKGGYTVNVLGKRAFCPGSQMEALGEGEDIAGRTMQFIVLRVENRGRNIIISRRALIDRERSENLQKVLATLTEGSVVQGKVTRLTAYGAFVELAPGVEGLVHISELSWSRVSKPEEAVNVGDTVTVKVLGIEKTDKATRISLSRKQAEQDPWNSVSDVVQQGAVLTGRVVRLMPFGAFVEIAPGIEGMVHVSEMAWGRRVNKPEEVVSPGDTVTVKVLDVVAESRRIALSIREAQADPWATVGEQFAVGATVEGTVESQSSFGIFVVLSAGITGLLPMQVIRNIKKQDEFTKLPAGSPITVVIQRIDTAARKISLVVPGYQENREKNAHREPREKRDGGESGDWKRHSNVGSVGMNSLAQAFEKALKSKKG